MNPSPTFSRRTCLKQFALALGAAALPTVGFSSRALAGESKLIKPTEREAAAMARISGEFMARFNVPGLSVAIARQGQFVYQQAFGFADAARREALTTSHRFRIASVSKPITSACIFSLVEQGKLNLDSPVFGAQGVLGLDYGKMIPGHVGNISVYHLLTHTCGGWENRFNDPMFMHPTMNHKQLIEWTLVNQPLKQLPGVHYDYSNFGYCVLGRIIEKITGQTYPEAVKQNILTKCNITTMQIGGNTLADRAANEVEYVGQNSENPYGMNIARMDSHGGWIATAGDLVQFTMHVDGLKTTPNILRPQTIADMTTPNTVNANYACGWAVNAAPNWWHIGSLPGTTTVMVRTARGFCWAALANTRVSGLDAALDDFVWRLAGAVPAWRA